MNGLMDPRNQFLLSMGANLMGRPASPNPQGAFGGLGAAMNQGMGAFQNAMVIQQAQQKAAAAAKLKQQEIEQQQKARAQLQSMISGMPAAQQELVLQRFDSDPKGTMEYLMKLAMPEPTADMRNAPAAQQRLVDAGLWDGLPDTVKAAVVGGAPIPPPDAPPQMTTRTVYNPQTGAFETVTGPGGAAGASNGLAAANEEAQQANEQDIFRDVIGEILSDPAFEGAVGPADSIKAATTGKMTDSREYQLRERLIKTIQPRIMAIGALVLKGSQTEKEWEMVRDTMPSPTDHPSVWRQWYADFSRVESEILRQKYGDEAYNDARGGSAGHMANMPMSADEAERHFKPGDVYTGLDGKKYRIEQ